VSAAGTERLHQYWVHGKGAGKIAWGTPGDFDRCRAELSKYIADAAGYCDLAHHAALGIWPAQHAAMDKKATGRSSVTTATRAEMTSSSINDLPDSDFAYIESGGKKDPSGRTVPRSLRHFPVHDAAHTRNALSRAPQSPFGDKAMPKIRAAAKKFGVDVSDDSKQPASRAEFMRLYALEDIHILRSADGGDGRTVEAYAAVFGEPAEIQDHEGHYVEEIDPAAFNRAIEHASRARGGFPGSVKVLWNHGRDLAGKPSDRFSMPIGVPVDIRAESRGLLTRTRYSDTPLADEVLENIRAGSITSQSFTGAIMRSTPQLRRGDRHRPDNAGNLRTVRRTELGLREYGPVLWPAYSGAEIVGVRMSVPGSWSADTDEVEEHDPGTSSHEEPAAGSPLTRTDGDEHETRYHQHALYRLRSKELREAKGLIW
jgi:HK97 family phage prohead protease